jgi:hypothetical protein
LIIVHEFRILNGYRVVDIATVQNPYVKNWNPNPVREKGESEREGSE